MRSSEPHVLEELKGKIVAIADKYNASYEFSAKYPDLKGFFQEEKWSKFMPHIKDFCIEYAVDSGKVPSC